MKYFAGNLACLFCGTSNLDYRETEEGFCLVCSNCLAVSPSEKTKKKIYERYAACTSSQISPAVDRRDLERRIAGAIWNSIIRIKGAEEQRYEDLHRRDEEDCLVETLNLCDFAEIADEFVKELRGDYAAKDEEDRVKYHDEMSDDDDEDETSS